MSTDLTVKPTFQNGQVVGWELCHSVPTNKDCGNGKTAAPYPKLDFNVGSGGHEITIAIINGNGVTFDPANPLWIQPNTKPTSPIIAPTDQIDPKQVKLVHPAYLKFHDANDSGELLLKYQLNFVDSSGNKVIPIDPDIKNGGKGFFGNGLTGAQTTALMIDAAIIAALVAAVVSAIVAYAVARRRAG